MHYMRNALKFEICSVPNWEPVSVSQWPSFSFSLFSPVPSFQPALTDPSQQESMNSISQSASLAIFSYKEVFLLTHKEHL